ncbi:MAG: DRTGG domain-containing protein [Bacteroidales bacterium]
MLLREIVEKLELKVFVGESLLDREIPWAYCSDLLSDVMGFAKESQLWITLQTHKNIIGVASLKDLGAILLVKNFTPDKETMALAEAEEIPILGSALNSFDLSGELYNLLK